MSETHSLSTMLRTRGRSAVRRRILPAALCLLMVAFGSVAPVRAEPKATAQWTVKLERDGHGSDASGAQLFALLAALGGTQGIATAEDKLTLPAHGDGHYTITSTLTPRGGLATLLRRLHWVRSASGTMHHGAPRLAAASDKRGDDPAETARIANGRLELRAGDAPPTDKVAPPGLLDPLSWAWGFLWRAPPSAPFDQALLIRGKVFHARVTPTFTMLDWHGTQTPVVLLDAETDDSEAGLRVWLRRGDGMPLQIALGLGSRYGLDVIQTLVAAPAGIAAR